jgi:hypothetical protein
MCWWKTGAILEDEMKRIIGAVLMAIALSMAGAVSAQGVQYAEQTEYSFDDDLVTGDLVRPDTGDIVVRKKGKERSLIRVRQHFISEMLKSVEDL